MSYSQGSYGSVTRSVLFAVRYLLRMSHVPQSDFLPQVEGEKKGGGVYKG